jgi:hypothetical protein
MGLSRDLYPIASTPFKMDAQQKKGDEASTQQDEAEIAVLQESFKSFDLNKDGSIDIEELGIGLSEKTGEIDLRLSVGKLTSLIESVDLNKDGMLQFDEFVELVKSKELEDLFQKEDNEPEHAPNPAKGISDLEEKYGQTPTPVETPSLIKEKLDQLKREIEKIPDMDKKEAIQAEEVCPHLAGDDFKMVFLRCEVFNVKVRRMLLLLLLLLLLLFSDSV